MTRIRCSSAPTPASTPPSVTAATARSAKSTPNTPPRPAARSPERQLPARRLPRLRCRPLRRRLTADSRLARSLARNLRLRRLARLRPLAQRRTLRGGERRPRPIGQILGIVEQARRQLPVRVHSHRLRARLILKRLRALRFELRNGLVIGTEIQTSPQREREVDAVGGDAEAGKH